MLLLSLITTLLALLANLLFSALDVPVAAGVAKMLASCGFLAAAFGAGAQRSMYGKVLLVGLVFSWWGDLLLLFPGLFLWGLVIFFLAHVAYSAAFLVHGIDLLWTATALALIAVPFLGVYRWLIPHTGDMRFPVIAYMVIISLMLLCAAGAAGKGATWLIPAGALLFYLSDVFVARERFVAPGEANGYIGLPLYYLGQLALASSARYTGR